MNAIKNYKPIKAKFLTEAGRIEIIPENINLVTQQYLDEYTYIFKVICKKIINDDVIFKVNIVASFIDGVWVLIKFDNYIIYTDKRSDILLIHEILRFEIVNNLRIFDKVFVKNYLTLKQDLYFIDKLITIKKVRKTDSTVICKINLDQKYLTGLFCHFRFDKTNVHDIKFVFDAFEYEEINSVVSDFIDKHGKALQEFLNTNINYIRII